jgi:hypothetical protein
MPCGDIADADTIIQLLCLETAGVTKSASCSIIASASTGADTHLPHPVRDLIAALI